MAFRRVYFFTLPAGSLFRIKCNGLIYEKTCHLVGNSVLCCAVKNCRQRLFDPLDIVLVPDVRLSSFHSESELRKEG